MRAPIVLGRYATLTYLNRTSRQRPINKLPALDSTHSWATVTCESVAKTKWDGPLGDVVVPVYNNFEDTRGLLESLPQQGASIGKIIVVNDCSTDRRIAPLIKDFADRYSQAVVLNNATNLGFVHACNRGLTVSDRDCIILNTDIELPPGSMGRLLHVLQSSEKIATVTPFSNSAYAVGVPHLNYHNANPFRAETAEIDACFQALRPLAPIALPRGVGFCMAISRQTINRLGPFRECFGQGYGEEADFCLRASNLGLHSVLAPHVYVYHKGEQSFGDSAKRRAREGAIRLLELHPSYVSTVARYLQGGEARVVGFAAMVLLAQRISGQETLRPEPNKRLIFHEPPEALEPELLLEKNATGVTATLRLAAETYRFRFSNARTLEAALSLVPSPLT